MVIFTWLCICNHTLHDWVIQPCTAYLCHQEIVYFKFYHDFSCCSHMNKARIRNIYFLYEMSVLCMSFIHQNNNMNIHTSLFLLWKLQYHYLENEG